MAEGKKKRKLTTGRIHGMTYNFVSQALWVLFIVVFSLGLVYGARQAYSFGYAVFSNHDRSVRDMKVTISILEGSSVITVGRQLEENGLIDDANVFWAQSIVFGYDVKPGVYTFSSRSSSRELLKLFDRGPVDSDGT